MVRAVRRSRTRWALLAPWAVACLAGCVDEPEQKPAAGHTAAPASLHAEPPKPHPPELPKLTQPVPLWQHGKVVREIDGALAAEQGYVLLDLGEAWTPYLFTDGVSSDGQKPLPNAYRPTYLALARGEFPDDHHGERAKNDKYLELYGILPTLHVVRDRMRGTSKLDCVAELDLTPLVEFTGIITYESNAAAKKLADDFVYLRGRVQRVMEQQHVTEPEQIDREALEPRDKDAVTRYLQRAPEWFAVDALQHRLECEGYFKTRGKKFIRGAMDWPTHDALAELERRHRLFSFGYLGKESLSVLRIPPMQAEHEGVLRVLVERAMHSAGVLEDGSTSTLPSGAPRTFKGKDGKEHPVPNLLADLRTSLIESFGLQTPESTLAWLESLGDLPKDEHRFVAIDIPQLPEYYGVDMQLTLDYDRGDVWYDFPFGDHGEELAQPVQRRPQVTVSVLYDDQKIPLARYGTTIGGWRSELVETQTMWKYKESPVGPRVWDEIAAAPVWLPPDSTPPNELLKKNRKKEKPEDPDYLVNYHETGPSYASAYGLVVAYHRTYFKRPDGRIVIGLDEGIRTHGSVDYMSIMRRHSHGCHRLHNHIALRLMSFVLAHRPHQRRGQEPLGFKKPLVYEDKEYLIDIDKGGYVFTLDQPIEVNVEEGRIRGDVAKAIEIPIPKYNAEVGAYITADGGAVQVRGDQLVSVPLPLLPDGGVPNILLPPAPGTTAPAGAAPTAVATTSSPASAPSTAPGAPLPAQPFSPVHAATAPSGASPSAAPRPSAPPPIAAPRATPAVAPARPAEPPIPGH